MWTCTQHSLATELESGVELLIVTTPKPPKLRSDRDTLPHSWDVPKGPFGDDGGRVRANV